MLAIGIKIGAVWVIPPLLAGLSVMMIFAVGRNLFSTRVGLVAAVLLAASPFAMVSATDYMSHNTAVFYLLASLLCLTLLRKQPLVFGLLAGLCFGLLLNTRPLTTTALVPPFGGVLLAGMLPRGQRWPGARALFAFVAGVTVMLGAYLLYNYGTTGDPFYSTAASSGDLGDAVGFAGRHSVGAGAANLETDMAFLLLILNGWPTYIGLMFVLVPFIAGTRNPWDWFLLAGAVSAMGAYVLYEGNGIQYGPRYWYEATPFLMLLSARGADRAATLLGEAGALVRRRVGGGAQGGRWAGAVVVYGFVAALVAFSLYSWLLGRNIRYHVFASMIPESAQSLKGWNDIDDRLQKKIDDAHLHHALVLMEPCFWQCYGSVFWLNDPGLDGNVVYAQDSPSVRADVLAAFPDRDVYFARYRGEVVLEPFTLDRGRTGHDPAGDAGGELVTARELLAVLPPVTPAPAYPAEGYALRDEQRRRDLSVVSTALDTYRMRHGSYPATGDVHSLCYFPVDAGCKLQEVLWPLPRDPGEAGYWYQSDGRSYVLFASLEGQPVVSDCPRPLPHILGASDNMYCVRSSGD
jgi:4-amino-4-deoxy-L-arabinose transferase-like glycosyltransferase